MQCWTLWLIHFLFNKIALTQPQDNDDDDDDNANFTQTYLLRAGTRTPLLFYIGMRIPLNDLAFSAPAQ